MFEFILSKTALPNIHPALVHFPIALAVAGLFVDLFSQVLRKRLWLGFSATLIYVLAAVGSIATYLSGRIAADTVGQLSSQAEAILGDHADLALLTMYALVAAAVLRSVAVAFNRQSGRVNPAAVAAIVVMAVANGLLVVTADLGGTLVFRHGVAVAKETGSGHHETEVPALIPVASQNGSFVRGEDGSLSWRPTVVDSEVFYSLFQAAKGASFDDIEVSQQVGSSDEGLRLSVSGASVVCIPEIFGDVVISATVDLGRFEGVFGLGHHIQSAGEGVFFTVTSGGEVNLFRQGAGQTTTVDQGSVVIPQGLVTLRTSVTGRHLKGQVGDLTVAHGHGPSGDDGAVGLFVDGQGSLLITQITVEPISDR